VRRYTVWPYLLVALLCPALVACSGSINFDELDSWLTSDINKTALIEHIHSVIGGILGGTGGGGVGGGDPSPPPAVVPAPPPPGDILLPQDPQCDLKYGGKRRSIIMVADEGDFSGSNPVTSLDLLCLLFSQAPESCVYVVCACVLTYVCVCVCVCVCARARAL
jgi:hypothetical protein